MNETILRHFELLGMRVKDKVTGVEGIADSLCFDLYGCVQMNINRGYSKEGKRLDGIWFDVTRLKILSGKRVMNVPEFEKGYVAKGKKGPADKASK